MPIRKPVEDWVQALRTFLRDQLGNTNWQLVEKKAGKTALGIRFEDGTRIFKYIPYKWQRANAASIRHFVESVHFLHIQKGIPLEEAFDRTKAQAPKDNLPRATTKKKILLDAWKKFEIYKVNQTGEVSQATWNKEYGGEPHSEESEVEPKRKELRGKTYSKLVKVADSQDANSLLINIGKFSEAGGRMREQDVQHIRAFLDYGVSKESGYLLNKDQFTPPAKANLQKYKGKKSKEGEAKSKEPTYPISEKEIFELIDSLDNPPEGKREDWKARAKEWSYAIKLAVTYGLRPIEVKFLEVRKNGREYVWCSYVKKAGNGTTDPRELKALHPEWEKLWNLRKLIKTNAPLPNMKQGAGEAFKNYLKFNPVWKRIKNEEKKNLVAYSFRHSYAMRAHSEYLYHPNELINFMGHKLDSHAKYGIYFDEQKVEDDYQRGIERRKNMKKQEDLENK